MNKTTVYKWCEPNIMEGPVKGQWIRSHIKFLRGGDVFKIPEAGEFLAVSDPYFNPSLKEYDIKMVRRQ
jgi:hypothetical protein